jgi:hypothetical protein
MRTGLIFVVALAGLVAPAGRWLRGLARLAAAAAARALTDHQFRSRAGRSWRNWASAAAYQASAMEGPELAGHASVIQEREMASLSPPDEMPAMR